MDLGQVLRVLDRPPRHLAPVEPVCSRVALLDQGAELGERVDRADGRDRCRCPRHPPGAARLQLHQAAAAPEGGQRRVALHGARRRGNMRCCVALAAPVAALCLRGARWCCGWQRGDVCNACDKYEWSGAGVRGGLVSVVEGPSPAAVERRLVASALAPTRARRCADPPACCTQGPQRLVSSFYTAYLALGGVQNAVPQR